MVQRIEPSLDLLDELARSAVEWAHNCTGDEHWTHSDDGYDYTRAALVLAAELMEMRMDGDTDRLGELLNTPGALVENYADVPPAIHELGCRAMEYEEDLA